MSTPERWIVIPKWSEFQHYKDRDPKWIKAYTRLLKDAEYLGLSFRLRGILHGIWLLYAASDGLVSGSSPARLGRMLGLDEVRARDLESLNHAGFITFSASKPLALRYQAASPEVEKEKKERAHARPRRKEKAGDGSPPTYEETHPFACPMPDCIGRLTSERRLIEHLANSHGLEGQDALDQLGTEGR